MGKLVWYREAANLHTVESGQTHEEIRRETRDRSFTLPSQSWSKLWDKGARMRALLAAFFFLMSVLMLDRCSGGGSSEWGSPVVLKGSLSSASYTVSTLSPFDRIWQAVVENLAFASGTRVDKIWALPMYNGEFHPQAMSSVKRISIG